MTKDLIEDCFGLFDDISWPEETEYEERHEFDLPQKAQERLRQICEETGETPEHILYEMFYEMLSKISPVNADDIKIRIYGQGSYPEFD